MPRSTVSASDQQLIDHAAQSGLAVTARQLERWRARGLLPPNIRRWHGRGRGSTSEPPEGSAELVVWLARNARPGRRPGDLALLAFAEGLPVPEGTVRAAFAAPVSGTRLAVERGMPPGASPEDVGDAAVAAGLRFTMQPARIRRIDHSLAQAGVNWSSPELAALDPGPSPSPPDRNGWIYTTVQMMRSGGEGVDMATIGAFARAMAPAGGAAPLAGQVEFRWPDSDDRDVPDDDEVLGQLLGNRDLREQTRDVAMTAPVAELREAFQLAAQLPAWADGLCSSVEQEIAAGQLGDATQDWVQGAFGLTRILLTSALQQHPGPAGAATTAVVLLLVRNTTRALRQLIPAVDFTVLSNPFVAPAFLVSFLDN
jgi:hypothetical protein